MPKVAVLALQGDFAEHAEMLARCGAEVVFARRASDLSDVDGLVIPGGESTTIAKLTGNGSDPIFDTIISREQQGMPVYGTCMGLIILANRVEGSAQSRLGLMDISVRRNAFGPQVFSREESKCIPVLGQTAFPLVFIRGPIILSVGSSVEIFATVEEGIVMCRQKNLLATAFHPELTDDLRVHAYFMTMISEYIEKEPGRGKTRSDGPLVRLSHLDVRSEATDVPNGALR